MSDPHIGGLIRASLGAAVLASEDVAVIHIDADNKIGCVSLGFCRLTNRDESSMVGTSLASLIPQGVKHIHNKPIDWAADALRTGEGKYLTNVSIIGGGGKIIALNLELALLEWPHQERPHFCAFASLAEN